jgi:hypothetical protein
MVSRSSVSYAWVYKSSASRYSPFLKCLVSWSVRLTNIRGRLGVRISLLFEFCGLSCHLFSHARNEMKEDEVSNTTRSTFLFINLFAVGKHLTNERDKRCKTRRIHDKCRWCRDQIGVRDEVYPM